MLDLHAVKSRDLKALSPTELTELASQMLAHIGEQSKHIDAQDKRIDSQAQGIKWRDAKIQSITFQLAKLKAWRFGAETERMNAEQRDIFEETFAADQASLEAQLTALQGSTSQGAPGGRAPEDQKRRQPKREALPAHLPRVDQRIEPEDTHCPTPECRQPMVRVGEDISERLDIVPAQFFVQRQIRGKWACKCCQLLVQEPAAAQVFDNALPTPGLQAHTVISRFVDHIPYYRQEQINARAGVHMPRSTLAAWSGHTGAQMMPLYEAHRAFVLSSRVLHADETPIALLDPGAGKTRRAYMWAYARGAYEPEPGVVYDFCLGRGGKYPFEFLKGWSGTLVVDAYRLEATSTDNRLDPAGGRRQPARDSAGHGDRSQDDPRLPAEVRRRCGKFPRGGHRLPWGGRRPGTADSPTPATGVGVGVGAGGRDALCLRAPPRLHRGPASAAPQRHGHLPGSGGSARLPDFAPGGLVGAGLDSHTQPAVGARDLVACRGRATVDRRAGVG